MTTDTRVSDEMLSILSDEMAELWDDEPKLSVYRCLKNAMEKTGIALRSTPPQEEAIERVTTVLHEKLGVKCGMRERCQWRSIARAVIASIEAGARHANSTSGGERE